MLRLPLRLSLCVAIASTALSAGELKTVASVAQANCFDPLGDYLGWQDTPPIRNASNIQFDSAGVAMVKAGPTHQYNPVTLTQVGLQEYSYYALARGGTNLVKYSEQLDNSAWSKTFDSGGSAPRVTPDASPAPDSSPTADRITWGATGSSYVQQVTGTSGQGGAPVTFSVYLRSAAAASVQLRIFAVGGSPLIQSVASVTPDWTRFSVSGTLDAGNNGSIVVRMAKRSGADVDAWGAQLTLTPSVSEYAKTLSVAVDGPASLRRATAAASWLVNNQDASGKWLYNYDFAVSGMGVTLRAPWASAMAQGQAASLLARLNACTGDPAYLTSAENGIAPLQQPVDAGGLARDFFGHPGWYEEYPTSPPSYALNGFEYTLIGLKDLSAIDPASNAVALFDQGYSALTYALPFFDQATNSSYHLGHLTNPPRKNYGATPAYHCRHILLGKALNAYRPNPTISFYNSLWQSYVTNGYVNCSNVL